MDDVNETIEEFREGLTDGSINAENLEQIFRERLPLAFDAAAKSLNLTNQEFSALLQNQIDVKDIIPVLETALKNAFGDIKPIDDTSAAVQRLSNNFETLAEKIAKATGVNDSFKQSIDQFAQVFDIKSLIAWRDAWSEYAKTQWEFINGNISMEEATQKNIATQNKLNAAINGLANEYQNTGKKAEESGNKAVDAAKNAETEIRNQRLAVLALEQEYENLGIQSASSLKKTADEMRESYEKIKSKGTEAAETMNAAFLKLAEAELKASKAQGGLIPITLQHEAATLGLKSAFQNLVDEVFGVSNGFTEITKRLDTLNQKTKENIDYLKEQGHQREEVSRRTNEAIQTIDGVNEALTDEQRHLLGTTAARKENIETLKGTRDEYTRLLQAQKEALKEAQDLANQDKFVDAQEQEIIDNIKKRIQSTEDLVDTLEGLKLAKETQQIIDNATIESWKGMTDALQQKGKALEQEAEWLRQNIYQNQQYQQEQVDVFNAVEKTTQANKDNQVVLNDGFQIRQDDIDSLARQYEAYSRLQKFIEDYNSFVITENKVINENYANRIKNNDAIQQEATRKKDAAVASGDLREAAEQENIAMEAAKDTAWRKFQTEQNNLESMKAELELMRQIGLENGSLTASENEQIAAQEKAIAAQQKKVDKEKEALQTTFQAIDASKQYNRVIDDFSDKVDDAARRNKTFTKEYEAFLKKVAEETKLQSQIASGFIQDWEQRLGSWSEKAKEAFQNVRSGTLSAGGSMDELSQAIAKNDQEMAAALRNMDTGWVKWANTAATQALQVERSFLSQAQAAKQLTENLNEAANGAYGSTTQLVGLIQKAEQARGNLKLLDDSSLSALESSIDSARQKLEDLRQEAIDAKNELEKMNAELAAEKGDSLTADLLNNEVEYRQKLADIEAKLSQAQAENNLSLIAIYQQQKQILEDIYNQKEKNIRQDEEERKKQATSSSSSSTSSSSGTTTKNSGTSTTTTHVLKLQAPDGSTATTNVDSEASVNQILEILRKAGLRMAG